MKHRDYFKNANRKYLSVTISKDSADTIDLVPRKRKKNDISDMEEVSIVLRKHFVNNRNFRKAFLKIPQGR